MADGNENGPAQSNFVSKLTDGRQRFLSHVIQHALACGRRSPDDFIRHFPPSAIMEGLQDQAQLRGRILVMATGVKEKIAVRKSVISSGEDLQIALDEEATTAEAVLRLFEADDRVRYLDPQRLWSFLIEGEFWNVAVSKKDDFERCKEHLAFMLDRALEDKLLTHRDVVEGVTVGELVMRLPKGELHKIIEGALANSHRGAPFTEGDLLSTMPPATLLKYVPLPHLWSSVVASKIAAAHGFVPTAAGAEADDDEEEEDTEDEAPRKASAAAAKD